MTVHHMSYRRHGETVVFVLRIVMVTLAVFASAMMTYLLIGSRVAAESPVSTAVSRQSKSTKPTIAPAQATQASQANGGNSVSTPPRAHTGSVATPRRTPASCSVATYSASPSKPTLAAAGFSQQVDAPTYYGISTDDPASLVAQTQACAQQQPALGGYEGLTGYSMNWSYAVTSDNTGQCRLADVRVGIHVNQLLPALEAGRSAAVQSAWSSIIGRLAAHENQHAAIDVAQAAALYNQLTSLITPCDAIAETARQRTSVATAALQSENASLDTTTDHGRA